MHKLTDSILDKFSMDFLRNQVLKNAYGNDDTVIAGLDPRVLLIWYLFFGLVPWFINDVVLLLGLFLFVVLTTRAARIATAGTVSVLRGRFYSDRISFGHGIVFWRRTLLWWRLFW